MEEKKPAHQEFQALKSMFNESPDIVRESIGFAKCMQGSFLRGGGRVSRAHPSHPQNRLARVLILDAAFK